MKKTLIPGLIILVFLSFLLTSCVPQAGEIIWQKNTPQTVYLTFDDGPDPVNTPKILDILRDNGVKATFFVIGYKAKANPQIIERINIEGHTLANHTYTHIDGYVIDRAVIKKELDNTHQTIFDASGVNVKLFRPPYGFFNWRAFKLAKEKGYKIAFWTFDISDWNVHAAKEYVKTVNNNLADGAIILMHDGGPKREELIIALPEIIKLIKEKGYKFSTNL
ncbi:MAG: polysaccharide deacetylase family protein [Candidatus Margulisbacteria bacterium]|nr:polysaccharide deacetylase family protein [Candidatus Margulisiibacteriota bacterium]MBU1021128.1 polysaccharide deacetylase family protein [Candidatus Margulisiibacteriota bacterium]MBU1728683.1 polysaccharide deacetylase family protein [Candidatus Margulisiibacteriota bacterium]MBU1955134.1 polysaccharide deacetylase family protein [Candidatus Margulisiibacteriota bacterium]